MLPIPLTDANNSDMKMVYWYTLVQVLIINIMKNKSYNYSDVLYWHGEICQICSDYPPDLDEYYLKTPCCNLERAICLQCVYNKDLRVNRWIWDKNRKWIKCPFCNAEVNLASSRVVRNQID